MKRLALAALLLAAGSAAAAPLPFAQERAAWAVPFKPFRIIGNVYYVGATGVSDYLIVTPKGDILTDGGLPEMAPQIERNIKALGFNIKDVKILLNSHAHFDHSGGLAKLKADSGAKFYASAGDRPTLESGHIGYGPASQVDTTPIHVDHVVADGEAVSLGGVTLTAHMTPGHTKGCTTWTYELPSGKGRPLSVMFFCSIAVAGNPLTGNAAYPAITDDYKASFAKLSAMDADIFLAPHGAQFDLAGKVARMKPGAPNPFIDPGEFRRFLAQARKDYDAELAKQFAQLHTKGHEQ